MYSAMKKNMASIANDTMNATELAPTNERDLKNSNWTIGVRPRISTSTNPARPTTAVASSETIAAEPHPHLLPSTRASTRAVSPIEIAAMPG